MNKNLLAVARHAGDISFAINGETKVSLSLGGEWVNLHNAIFTGDQGCVYPNRPPEAGEASQSALDAALRALESMKVVPYQNDSTYEKYATDEANVWLNKTLPALLVDLFRNKHDTQKVQASYIPEGEKDPVVVVSVEVVTNQYANGIFENLGNLLFMGDVTSASISEGSEVTYVYRDIEGNENTIVRDISDNTCLIGADQFSRVKKLWSSDNDAKLLVLGSENFDPLIEESKIILI